MISILLLLAVTISIFLFATFDNIIYLYVVLCYMSFNAIIAYHLALKSILGLVTFETEPTNKIVLLVNCVYLYTVCVSWFYTPIWAALLTPWIVVITAANTTLLFVRQDEND